MRKIATSFMFRQAAMPGRYQLAAAQSLTIPMNGSLRSVVGSAGRGRLIPSLSRLSTTTTPSPISPNKTEEENKPVTEVVKPQGRFRELVRNYGVVFLGLYSGVYLVTLGSVFEIVSLKHIDAKSAVDYLHSVGVDQYVDLSPIASSKAGNFALAWILTKFTEPLRLAFTVTITPSFARLIGRAPPKKPKAEASEASKATEGSG